MTSIKVPSIHFDMPQEVYRASLARSRSDLMKLRISPKHYIYHVNNPPPQTPQLIFGAAFHTYVLEPEMFQDRYFVAHTKADRRTKEGKIFHETLLVEAGKRTILTLEDFHLIKELKNSLFQEADIARLISSASYEVSLFWHDLDSDIICKARPDIMRPKMIIDIKTTTDASYRAFKNDAFKYGYNMQAAMMQAGLAANGHQIDDFVFVCVEKQEPYAVGIYTLSPKTLDIGRDEYKTLLMLYKKCVIMGHWPSYPTMEI